ncbi:arylsulfatase [Opitutia bacterium ISCC 51]|nr:arylsulfatase [Opitutae bacterium ISCC 51]QXD27594.1 arylsulfatase [Opitutae bacterium ISCC 52]
MNPRYTKHLLVLSIIFTLALLSRVQAERPNIVFIYADDIGYGDFSCYGGTGMDTAYTGKLAANGLRFLSGYSSAATCTPSRYSLLTGQYAFRNKGARILPGNAPLIIDPKKPTIANFLRDEGYSTALVGKWHLGLGSATEPLDWNAEIKPGPREVGFEYSFHIAATGDRVPSVYIEDGYIVDHDPNDPISVSYSDPVGNEPTGISHPHLLKVQADEQHSGTIVNGVSRIGTMTGGHKARFVDEDMADVFVEKAVNFIEREKDNPFFLYFATHDNHVPRVPHKRFVGSSSIGLRGDAVMEFDWCVKQIVLALEENGLTENTMIVLSSDNGPVLFDGYWDGAIERNGEHKAAGPWRGGKYGRWEGGTRMPFIVTWPGKIEPGISDAIVSQVDLFASIAALLGKPMPEGSSDDSQNLLPALLGQSPDGRDYQIEEALGELAIRKENWKFIPQGGSGVVRHRLGIDANENTPVPEEGFLFHLSEDPMEQINLASKYPHKVAELMGILKEVAPEKF